MNIVSTQHHKHGSPPPPLLRKVRNLWTGKASVDYVSGRRYPTLSGGNNQKVPHRCLYSPRGDGSCKWEKITKNRVLRLRKLTSLSHKGQQRHCKYGAPGYHVASWQPPAVRVRSQRNHSWGKAKMQTLQCASEATLTNTNSLRHLDDEVEQDHEVQASIRFLEE